MSTLQSVLSHICVPAWLQMPASYNPPCSTSGETLPTSQVFLKGLVVMVLLVHCQSLNPGSSPVPTAAG
jgi:hypothetical protein